MKKGHNVGVAALGGDRADQMWDATESPEQLVCVRITDSDVLLSEAARVHPKTSHSLSAPGHVRTTPAA